MGIFIEDNVNPLTFTNTNDNIFDRHSQTPPFTQWDVPSWNENESTTPQQTPDISSLINYITSKPNWQSGNSMVFLFANSDNRQTVQAHSFDSNFIGGVPRLVLDIPFFSLGELTGNPPTDTKKKSGGCDDCIPPTIGLAKNMNRIVENGLTFNGESINVDRTYTKHPPFTTPVGEKNTLELVIYENHGWDEMSFIHIGFGLENKYDPMNNAEAYIDYHFKDVKLIDENNILQNVHITSIEDYKCSKKDTLAPDCTKIIFEYEYREAPLYSNIAIQIGDEHGNKLRHFFDGGIIVTGESLNDQPIVIVSGIQYTRIDKINDIWVNDGIEYQKTSETLYKRITPWTPYVCNDTPLDEINGPVSSSNCNFRALVPS